MRSYSITAQVIREYTYYVDADTYDEAITKIDNEDWYDKQEYESDWTVTHVSILSSEDSDE